MRAKQLQPKGIQLIKEAKQMNKTVFQLIALVFGIVGFVLEVIFAFTGIRAVGLIGIVFTALFLIYRLLEFIRLFSAVKRINGSGKQR